MQATQMSYDIACRCMPILEMNHAESGQLKDEDFNPTMDDFIEANDEFIAFLLWTDANEIVGVAFFFLGQHTQYAHLSVADQLTFYIMPDYRSYAVSFLHFTEHYFETHMIDIIQQGAIQGSRFSKLLRLKKYKAVDISYIKRLS